MPPRKKFCNKKNEFILKKENKNIILEHGNTGLPNDPDVNGNKSNELDVAEEMNCINEAEKCSEKLFQNFNKTSCSKRSACSKPLVNGSAIKLISSTLNKYDQTKIPDYFQVRRSSRTNSKDLKNKEKEELDKLILNKERELNEGHLKVEEIEGKGRGVLACRLFSRGEFVVEYAGDLIELSTAKQRESKYQLSPTYGCYMYYFNCNNKHYCVDATEETGRLGRLVNHSRLKPNCGTRVVMVDNIPRLILVTLKRIQEGEEILYDYGDRNKESLLAHPWLAF